MKSQVTVAVVWQWGSPSEAIHWCGLGGAQQYIAVPKKDTSSFDADKAESWMFPWQDRVSTAKKQRFVSELERRRKVRNVNAEMICCSWPAGSKRQWIYLMVSTASSAMNMSPGKETRLWSPPAIYKGNVENADSLQLFVQLGAPLSCQGKMWLENAGKGYERIEKIRTADPGACVWYVAVRWSTRSVGPGSSGQRLCSNGSGSSNCFALRKGEAIRGSAHIQAHCADDIQVKYSTF